MLFVKTEKNINIQEKKSHSEVIQLSHVFIIAWTLLTWAAMELFRRLWKAGGPKGVYPLFSVLHLCCQSKRCLSLVLKASCVLLTLRNPHTTRMWWIQRELWSSLLENSGRRQRAIKIFLMLFSKEVSCAVPGVAQPIPPDDNANTISS